MFDQLDQEGRIVYLVGDSTLRDRVGRNFEKLMFLDTNDAAYGVKKPKAKQAYDGKGKKSPEGL